MQTDARIGSEPTRQPRGKVLVVDDVEANRELLRKALVAERYHVRTASDGEGALATVREDPPDVILLDVMMPGRDGFEICRLLKQDVATRLIPVVLVTALGQTEKRVHGAMAGADDFLTKPVDLAELRARVHSLVRLKRYTDDLDSAAAIIVSFGQIIEARDEYTQGHCQRIASYGSALGRAVGLSDEDTQALYRGGYLHDVGKIVIPDAILLKPGALTPAEYEIVKRHPVVGDEMCGNLRSLRTVRPIVRHHHERLDGSGYPDGLSGDQVPLVAQITGLVDVYDALTTDRPYRVALTRDHALQILRHEVQIGWRRDDLLDAFIRLVEGGRFDRLTTLDPSSEQRGVMRERYTVCE